MKWEWFVTANRSLIHSEITAVCDLFFSLSLIPGDGSSVHFNTTETNVLEMIAQINTKARTL